MTTKAAILSTVGILVAVLVLGFVALFLLVDPRSGNANERAAMLGQGIGQLSLVPIAVVWIMWAVRIRAERKRKQRSGS